MKLQLFKLHFLSFTNVFFSDQRFNSGYQNAFHHHVSPLCPLLSGSFSVSKKDFNFAFSFFFSFLIILQYIVLFFLLVILLFLVEFCSYIIIFCLYSFTTFLYYLFLLFLETNYFAFYWKWQFSEIPLFMLQYMFLENCSSSESSGDVSLTSYRVVLNMLKLVCIQCLPTHRVCELHYSPVYFHITDGRVTFSDQEVEYMGLWDMRKTRKEENVFLSNSRCFIWNKAWLFFSFLL